MMIKSLPRENWKESLESIYGRDIDAQAVANYIDNLNSIVKDFNIHINWNIYKQDAVRKILEKCTEV